MNIPTPIRAHCFLLLALAAGLCSVPSTRAQSQPVAVTTLHYFANNPDGASPYLGLVAGSDNSLYGCTSLGGTNDVGIIFKINRDGSGYSVLHSFSKGENQEQFPIKRGAFLIRAADGALYGVTQGGTTYTLGVLFKLNTDGSGYTILNAFTNVTPNNILQANDGMLYGAGFSAIFKIGTDGNNFTTLHTFNTPVDGRIAYGQLVQGTDGFLYGTAESGGSNNVGTVFKLDTNGNTFTVLHTFGGTNDGAKPYGGLIQADNGALVGATSAGGTNNAGTLYGLNPDGSGYQVVHHFQTNGFDGLNACSALTKGLNHLLYGTTAGGGTNGVGTVYEIGMDGSGYQTVWSFDGTNGINTFAGLAQGLSFDNTGVLYGLGQAGGIGSEGTIYAVIVNPPVAITPAVTAAGNNPVVVWPAWALNYQLQTTTNPGGGAWTTVSNGVPITGMQLTNVPPGSYYRLIWNSSN